RRPCRCAACPRECDLLTGPRADATPSGGGPDSREARTGMYSGGVPNADPFRPQRLGPVSLFRSEHLSDALDPTGLRPFPTRTAGAIHRRASRAPRASFTHGRTREKETFVTETTANDTHARS